MDRAATDGEQMTDETGRRDLGGEAEDPVGGSARPPEPHSGPSPALGGHLPSSGQGGAPQEPSRSAAPDQSAAHRGPAPETGPAGPHPPVQTWANAPASAGGPGPWQPPYRPPTGPWPAAATLHGAHASAPRRRSGGLPLWAVLLVVAVVAAVSAGVGGVVGASLTGGDTPAPQGANALNNDVPSDVPSRAPDTIAGVAQRVSPSVVSIRSTSPRLSGNGSGFVIEDDYVVTNNHVVDAVEQGGIEVVYSDGHVSRAEVVGAAASSDLAVLRLMEPLDVEPLEFGDSD